MADDTNDTDKIHAPWTDGGDNAPTSAQALTTGGLGSGAVATDTGGLDAMGNELGTADPGTSHGQAEKEHIRSSDADAQARK